MPPPLIEDTAHTGAASTLSVAGTATATSTSCPFGGSMDDGVAETAVMTGALVSGGTTTSVEDAGDTLPAASAQVTLSVYVLPPTARTRAVRPVKV